MLVVIFVWALLNTSTQTGGLNEQLIIKIGDTFDFREGYERFSDHVDSKYQPGENWEISSYEVTDIDTDDDTIQFSVENQVSQNSQTTTSYRFDEWGSKAIYPDFTYWHQQRVQIVQESQVNRFEYYDDQCVFGLSRHWYTTEIVENETITSDTHSIQIYARDGVLLLFQDALYIEYEDGSRDNSVLGSSIIDHEYCLDSLPATISVGTQTVNETRVTTIIDLTSTIHNVPVQTNISIPQLSMVLPSFEWYYVLSLGTVLIFQRSTRRKVTRID